jgi:chitin synthase
MIGAKERYQIQMNTGAFCKTEAVQEFRSLLKQRRRWFLGFITNEVCMLTDIRLWKRYPILCVVRFCQNTIRTTALLFFIMVISIITTSQKIKNLPVGFIAVSLGLNWILMLYFGAKLGRYKIMLYPLMFVVNPFFNWLYMVYGIFTAGQRTWGGPRADAGTADATTTPQAAIEHAEATGDDLNIVPETFKPAVEAVFRKKSTKNNTVLPSDDLDGRFAAAELMPGGWYKQTNDSQQTVPKMMHRTHPAFRRSSLDSIFTATSAGNSIYIPRRVESIVAPDDASLYHRTQEMQRPAGGAIYQLERRQTERSQTKGGYSVSVASDDDDDSFYGGRPVHSRMTSDSSEHGVPRVRQPSYPMEVPVENQLAVPARVQRPHERQMSQTRAGRSPLARRSFVTSAADLEVHIPTQPQNNTEMAERNNQQRLSLIVPRTQSPAVQAEPPTEAALSTTEEKQRRRLSKYRPESK